ncbi:MAG: glycerol-3-phosphate dehydrogenase [Caulobacteraceae bacterium]|nr:glycerol-3-phosphate dehydrogenase [Caulobacter sp.]
MSETAPPVDLLVVGGGVNGCGIARDAAGRGLTVVLVEAGDLAGATSSASSKLIHGGLRYLEQYAFRLVRESLAEREVLLASAPHLIYPLRFVLPHHRGLRPAWLLRLGLLLYDHIGGRRSLPGTRSLDLPRAPQGGPLKPDLKRAFEYSDAWTDDARMVVLAALDAAEHGARVLTRTRLVSARREAALWRAELQGDDGRCEAVAAHAIVNAAGPWVDEVARTLGADRPSRTLKLVKGSHIVLPRLYEGDWAYTLQQRDGRVVFAIPYERAFTLVGTTDTPVEAPGAVNASPEEVAYLCEAVNDYFSRTITPADVVWSYAGVRPLHDDGGASASQATRDYALDLDAPEGLAPLLTVYGGKITTFRRLGEHALRLLAPRLGLTAPDWTAGAHLPGGDLPQGFAAFRDQVAAARPWLDEPHLTRLCRAYGSRLQEVLGDARSWADLGRDFGAGLTGSEIAYLRRVEWARTADDVLWRRTKVGLHMTPEQRAAVAFAFT